MHRFRGTNTKVRTKKSPYLGPPTHRLSRRARRGPQGRVCRCAPGPWLGGARGTPCTGQQVLVSEALPLGSGISFAGFGGGPAVGGVSLDKTALGSNTCLPAGIQGAVEVRGSGGRTLPRRVSSSPKLSTPPLSKTAEEDPTETFCKRSLSNVSFFPLLHALGLFQCPPVLRSHGPPLPSLLFWKPKSCFCWAGPS